MLETWRDVLLTLGAGGGIVFGGVVAALRGYRKFNGNAPDPTNGVADALRELSTETRATRTTMHRLSETQSEATGAIREALGEIKGRLGS